MAKNSKKSDEELFASPPADLSSVDGFWAAKRLSPRRAMRLHYWLAGISGELFQLLANLPEEGEEIDWPHLINEAINALDEDKYLEILSIASGHTPAEIEDNFDYPASWTCLVDFIEINRLGSAVQDFFGKMGRLGLGKGEKAK